LEHFLLNHILGTCSNPNWFSYFSEGLVNHQPATIVSKNLGCRCREGFLHPAPQDAPVAAPETRMWGAPLGGLGTHDITMARWISPWVRGLSEKNYGSNTFRIDDWLLIQHFPSTWTGGSPKCVASI
jgi:hypothetical protein